MKPADIQRELQTIHARKSSIRNAVSALVKESEDLDRRCETLELSLQESLTTELPSTPLPPPVKEEHSHTLSNLPPPTSRHHILDCPTEVVIQIMDMLDMSSLLQARTTCSLWFSASQTNGLWEYHFVTQWCAWSPSVPVVGASFRRSFFANANVRNRFKQGCFHSTETPAHSNAVVSTTWSPNGALLASGSADKTIKLWNSNSKKLVKTITGHRGDVNGLHFITDNVLLSCSGEREIKLHDIHTGGCIKTIRGQGMVYTVTALDNNTIVSGGTKEKGRKPPVRVWDLRSGLCTMQLVGHQQPISCLGFHKGNIVSAAEDGMVKLWDLGTASCLHTQPFGSPIYGLYSDDHLMVCGGNPVNGHVGLLVHDWKNNAQRIVSVSENSSRLLYVVGHTYTGLSFSSHKGVSCLPWSTIHPPDDALQLVQSEVVHLFNGRLSPQVRPIGKGAKLPEYLNDAAFSPDGSALVGAGNSGVLWWMDFS